jgi:signal transduction histidine kinase
MSQPENRDDAWRRLAAAGHDLRQPVHALGLYLAVLARKEADAELGPRLAAALDEVRDSFDLVLDFAKLQAGGWRPRPREFQLGELFAAMRERLASQARVRAVELRFVGGRLRGRGDPDLLRRAVTEIAGLAVRAARGGRVLIGARPRGGEILVEVRQAAPAQVDRSDELALALSAGLAQLAGGALRREAGRSSVAIPAA